MKIVSYKERAKFYDVEYLPLDDTKFLMHFLNNKNVSNILEIPCGSGFHLTFFFAFKDKHFHLMDKENRMIFLLKEKLKRLGNPSNISCSIGEFGKLKSKKKYDLIIVPQESFQLILSKNEALRTLNCFFKHLSDNGKLIIDLASFDEKSINVYSCPVYYSISHYGDKIHYNWQKGLANGNTLIRKSSCRKKNDTIWLTFYYLEIGDKTSKFKSELKLKIYSKINFAQLSQMSGFKVHQLYGNYNLDLYKRHDPRLIWILKKDS